MRDDSDAKRLVIKDKGNKTLWPQRQLATRRPIGGFEHLLRLGFRFGTPKVCV